MAYIQGRDRRQSLLLPENLEDLVTADNPVRVLDAFVDQLDLQKLGFKRSQPAATGRPAYAPGDLLKLYIYGYFNHIRSSRKLMTECGRNIELFYLLNRLQPDFRTIAAFRQENPQALKAVFQAFVQLCLKLDLYHKELVAIDGSKFRAVNSKDRTYNAEILAKKLQHIQQHLDLFLAELDQADAAETETRQPERQQIEQAIQDLKQRQKVYESYQQQLQDSGDSQLLLTDPEAHRMHTKDGFNCCYNVQTAVDSGSHLIAAYEVTNHNTDQGLLTGMADAARQALAVETLAMVADKGYESRQDILACIQTGILPQVALKYDRSERVFNLDYVPADMDEARRRSTQAADIQACLQAGIRPACYDGTDLVVERQQQTQLSCFLRNPDDTVTCPMRQILTRQKQRGRNTIYANKDACRQCQNRCTSSKNFKTVSFGPGNTAVPVRMYGSPHTLNPLPPDAVISSYNHTLNRKDYAAAQKVVVRIRENPEQIRQRKCTVEHPFGTVKWYGGAHYLLCKGKEKVAAEIGLSYLAYNLKRDLNLVGVRGLRSAISQN